MICIEYEGEVYYLMANKFVDSTYIAVEKNKGIALAKIYFDSVDMSKFNRDEFLDNVRLAKELESYSYAKKACEYGINKFYNDVPLIRSCLPIYTSVCRSLNQPQQAIDFAREYIHNNRYVSEGLLTSVAAAYCDMEDYTKAKKYADWAYAIQHGSVGFNELSLVYKRIEKRLKGI